MFAGKLLDVGLRAMKEERPMQLDELLPLPPEERCDASQSLLLEAHWNALILEGKTPSMLRAVLRTYWKALFLGWFLRLLHDGAFVAVPFVFRELVIWFQTPEAPVWEGVVLCIAMASLNSLALVTMQYGTEVTLEMFQSLRGALHVMIFKKSLRLKSIQGVQGKIVALHGTDVARLKEVAFIHAVFTAPFAVVGNILTIYFFVGYAVFFVCVILLVATPVQSLISRSLGAHIASMSSFGDRRLKMISEVLLGIRVCKFMNWEKSFEDQIEKVRAGEVKALERVVALRNWVIGIAFALPILLQLAVFGGAYGLGEAIKAEAVFPVLALLNTFRALVGSLSLGISRVVDLKEILWRCTTLLSMEEKETYLAPLPTGTAGDTTVVCRLKNITFGSFEADTTGPDSNPKPSGCASSSTSPTTTSNTNEPVTNDCSPPDAAGANSSRGGGGSTVFKPLLRDVNLSFEQGTLTIVTGPTGSGKSILIQALLGEGTPDPQSLLEGGTVERSDDRGLAYVPQEAWIMNATFRRNITLDTGDEQVDESLYNKAIRCCCLGSDVELLPAGDATEIGERGVNLSGGQKQRLALARALYSPHDLVLMDDPLSAVDPQVCATLFHDCVAGAMKGRTRVLVTHHVQFLPFADQVILVRNGAVEFAGSYSEYWHKMVGCHTTTGTDGAIAPSESPLPSRPSTVKEEGEEVKEHQEREQEEEEEGKGCSREGKDNRSDESPKGTSRSGKLVVDEDQKHGAVGVSVYRWYLGLASRWYSVNFLLGYLAWRAGQMFCDVWLQLWATKSPGFGQTEPFSQNEYLLWFCVTGAAGMVGTAWRQWATGRLVISVSAHSHRPLLRSLLHAPLSFFDTTPAGRILNRFSKDMQALDMLLPEYGNFAFSNFVALVGSILLILVVSVYLVPVLLVCLVVFYRIGVYFAATSRALKRIENVERSPMMAVMSEVLTGLETIRAYSLTNQFLQVHNTRTDSMFRALYAQRQSMLWLVTRVCFIGFIFFLSLGASAVLYKEVDAVSEATFDRQFVMLALALVNHVTNLMIWLLLMGVEMDHQMSSAERAKEYCEEMPQEVFISYEGDTGTDEEDKEDKPSSTTMSKVATHLVTERPPNDWPSVGSLHFENVSIRYRDGPLVLKDLTFGIPDGAKVGVVGRTGSGKSTLMLALFRLLELAQGRIDIAGHDIAKVKLDELRRQISIIPQDPTLFEGTVRSNLDPFGHWTDSELWQVLKEVRLEERILSEADEKGEAKGLDCVIAPKGSNFSVGQRQLMCLARALLKTKEAKILLLDEATASVDFEADAVIQETIRTAFAHHTVITIAHRLATVIESDRILVLQNGELVEYDSPASLLEKPNGGFFADMVSNLGPEQAKKLTEQAQARAVQRKQRVTPDAST